jgi:membrane protein YdbS with pleckstrin-like domain
MTDQPDPPFKATADHASNPAAHPTDPHGNPLAADSPAAGGDGAPVEPAAETTLWTGRTHWHHYFGRVVLAVIAAALIWWVISALASHYAWPARTASTVAALISLLILAVVSASILYRIIQCRYRLTNQRLFVERGIIRQTIDQTELIRVDDVRVHKALVDRFLRMGSIEVHSTDATDAALLIVGVKDADHVSELLRTNMRALRSRSLFVERL